MARPRRSREALGAAMEDRRRGRRHAARRRSASAHLGRGV